MAVSAQVSGRKASILLADSPGGLQTIALITPPMRSFQTATVDARL